jgi:heme exporter protein C
MLAFALLFASMLVYRINNEALKEELEEMKYNHS